MKEKILFFLLLCFFVLAPFYAENFEDDEIPETTKRIETLKYGIESDIISLVDTLIKEEDKTYKDDLLAIFETSRNVKVKEKIIEYFIQIKDPSLTNYAISILEDPYDQKKSIVGFVFRYVSELKIKEACPQVMELLKSENEDYYDNALSAIGKIGGSEEALFVASLLDSDDLTVGRKQAIMRSLGELNAVETFDKLVEIAKDTEENTFVRMYACESIGNMKKQEAVDVLVDLFEESDNNLRTYVLKGISNFNDEKSKSVILEGFKDNYHKIRLEAAQAAEKNKIEEAVPYLLYRAKNDPESSVKYACYNALGTIQTKEAVDYLISVVTNKKLSETARAKAAVILLKNKIYSSYDSIILVARDTLKDDKLKNLRYALGKEFAKYEEPKFEDICREYLAHKDVLTCGTGLDIFAKNNFDNLVADVKAISINDKAGANKRKARLILEKISYQNVVETENSLKNSNEVVNQSKEKNKDATNTSATSSSIMDINAK